MEALFRFAHPEALYILLPIVVLLLVYHFKKHKNAIYRYSLATDLNKRGITSTHPYKKVFFTARLCTVLLLAFLVGKPQRVDVRDKIDVEGIDIVLALDVSGSMQRNDDNKDQRSRIEIAKEEAIRFIEKRDNDAIGIVIFGQDAVSRCPLTMDKNILKEMVQGLSIGIVDPDGTVLSTALVAAANRLKNSDAKSKVIILLTDGDPSEHDINPNVAIEAVKKMGIKVYTVGIGSEKEEYIRHPFYGFLTVPGVNKELLKRIAVQTKGKFFMAHSSADMRSIYDTIDVLEKTDHETPVFSVYYDVFMPFVVVLFCWLLLESWLAAFIWFGL